MIDGDDSESIGWHGIGIFNGVLVFQAGLW